MTRKRNDKDNEGDKAMSTLGSGMHKIPSESVQNFYRCNELGKYL
jgi:hypothetical protein